MSGAAKKLTAAILVLGTAAMLALNLPGQLSPDSVSQFYEGRSGLYNSWHPPVMAWLLGLFDWLWPGTGLFLLFDALLLAGAWGLLLWQGRNVSWPACLLALAMVLTPQFLLYQGTVWKDVLFADVAIAGFAVLAVAARRNASIGDWRWLALFAALLILAALTRQNGLVLLPIGAAALGWIRARRPGERQGMRYGMFYAAAMLAVTLLLAAAINLALAWRGDHGEGAAAEIRVAQSYDLIGALAASPGLKLPLMDAQDSDLSHRMRGDGVRFYSPRSSEMLAGSRGLTEAISDAPDGLIFAQWEDLVLHHPLLYLSQRWPVFVWVLASPDVAVCHPAFSGIDGDPEQLKALGLHPRMRPQDRWLAAYARGFMGTPVLSHLMFLVLALALLLALLWRRQDADIAIAGMLAGALVFTASFFAISIACDYRYLDFLDLAALTAAFYWAVSRQTGSEP